VGVAKKPQVPGAEHRGGNVETTPGGSGTSKLKDWTLIVRLPVVDRSYERMSLLESNPNFPSTTVMVPDKVIVEDESCAPMLTS
jgi:hypothetical protein